MRHTKKTTRTTKITKSNTIQTIKRKDTKKLKYNPTFILSMRDDGIEYNTDIFRDMIQKLGLQETKDAKSPTSYLHMQSLATKKKYESKYYDTPTLLMNILNKDKEVITNKSNLYANYNRKFPVECAKYMARTWNVKNFDTRLFKNVEGHRNIFIVRPVGVGAFSGIGVEVVSNKQEFLSAKHKLQRKYPTVIISEYISRPMLWDGKKFHLRTYLLAKSIDGKLTTYFYDYYEVFTAEKPYVASNWRDMDIHDTHLKSVGKYIVGPMDFDEPTRQLFTSKIWPEMANCMKYVSKLLEGHARPYPNAANAFEVFGCDFMITEDYKVKLLEVNEKTGLSMADFPDRRDEFSNWYFGKIRDLVLIPFFQPKIAKNKLEYYQEPLQF